MTAQLREVQRVRSLTERLAYMFIVGGAGQLALIVVRAQALFGAPGARPEAGNVLLLEIGIALGLMAFAVSLPITLALLAGKARHAARAVGALALMDVLTPVIVIAILTRQWGGAQYAALSLAASAGALGLQIVLGWLFLRESARPLAPDPQRIAAAVTGKAWRRFSVAPDLQRR